MVRRCRITSTFITLMGEHTEKKKKKNDGITIDKPRSDLCSCNCVSIRISKHVSTAFIESTPRWKLSSVRLHPFSITSEPFSLPGGAFTRRSMPLQSLHSISTPVFVSTLYFLLFVIYAILYWIQLYIIDSSIEIIANVYPWLIDFIWFVRSIDFRIDRNASDGQLLIYYLVYIFRNYIISSEIYYIK